MIAQQAPQYQQHGSITNASSYDQSVTAAPPSYQSMATNYPAVSATTHYPQTRIVQGSSLPFGSTTSKSYYPDTIKSGFRGGNFTGATTTTTTTNGITTTTHHHGGAGLSDSIERAMDAGRIYRPLNSTYVPGSIGLRHGMSAIYDSKIIPTFEGPLELIPAGTYVPRATDDSNVLPNPMVIPRNISSYEERPHPPVLHPKKNMCGC